MESLDTIDPTFVDDLLESDEAVLRVAGWLRERGYPVIQRPVRVRPSAEDRFGYSDGGDLEILQRVEVKRRRNIAFTGRDDYPYDTVIVDAAHKWDAAFPRPFVYVILNDDMTAALIVEGRTSRQWERVKLRDEKSGRLRDYYVCPIELTKETKL